MNNKAFLALFMVSLLAVGSCGSPSLQKDKGDTCYDPANPQYNITVFLDLSDRIDTTWGYGRQWQYDTAAVMEVVERFLADAQSRTTYCAEGMIRFRVQPPNPTTNACYSSTEVDFSKYQVSERMGVWKNMKETWRSCISSTYNSALTEGRKDKWPGSDFWGFMRDESALEQPKHRNILIVLTDGEPYDEGNSSQKQGLETANMTAVNVGLYAKYSEEASLDALRKAGVSILNPRKGKPALSDLEVVVLGIRPTAKNTQIFPMLKYLWTDWFQRMGVDPARITIQKSGSTIDAKNAIDATITIKQ